MITVIVLGVLAAVGIVVTIADLPRDGYRRIPTDRTRLP